MQIQSVVIFIGCCYLTRGEDVTFNDVNVLFADTDGPPFVDVHKYTILYSNDMKQMIEEVEKAHSPLVIKHFEVSYQNVPVIYKNTFNHVNMSSVSFRTCGIKEIQPGAFQGSSIKYLEVIENELEIIKRDTFNVARVDTLDLHSNGIRYTEEGAFCSSFDTIYLYDNNLAEIPRGVFNGTSIKRLYLGKNSIKKIHKGAFSNNTHLRELNLIKNLIESIESGAFEHTPNLVYINLAYNSLKIINRGIFSHVLWTLTTLSLDRNIQSGASESSIFENFVLPNNLKAIQEGSFNCCQGNISFRSLDLSYNKLEVIEEGAVRYCKLRVYDW